MILYLFIIVQLQLHVTGRYATVNLQSPATCCISTIISIRGFIISINLICILVTVKTAVSITIRECSLCCQSKTEIILSVCIDICVTSHAIFITGNVTSECSRVISVTIRVNISDIIRIIICIRAINRTHFKYCQDCRVITVTTRQTNIVCFFISSTYLCTDSKPIGNFCIQV